MQISFEKRKKLVIVNIFLQQFQCLYSTILLLFICNVDDLVMVMVIVTAMAMAMVMVTKKSIIVQTRTKD